MKKVSIILSLMMILALCGGVLTGCGSASGEPSYSDSDFLKDMAKGLEDRWALADKHEEEENIDEQESKNECIQKELDRISEYTSAQFEDTKLQEYAIQYINVLNDQMEALKYFDADYSKYYDMWEEAYYTRCQLIVAINSEYGLDISEKHKETLDELTATGEKKNEQDKVQKAIDKELKNLEFKKEDDNLVAIFENTSDKTIKSVCINCYFYDKDGVKIDESCEYAENLKPGEKCKISFWVYDVDYEKYKLSSEYLEYED